MYEKTDVMSIPHLISSQCSTDVIVSVRNFYDYLGHTLVVRLTALSVCAYYHRAGPKIGLQLGYGPILHIWSNGILTC